MKERYSSKLAVSLVLTRINENDEKEVLLQLRQNTGYMDNMYDFSSSGHIEKGESFKEGIIREAKEELGITIDEKDLEFLILYHHYKDDYVQVVFTTKNYIGIPTINEPEKCKGLLWANINNIPENTIPYTKTMLKDIQEGILYNDTNSYKIID
jgi:mutator protein MutT